MQLSNLLLTICLPLRRLAAGPLRLLLQVLHAAHVLVRVGVVRVVLAPGEEAAGVRSGLWISCRLSKACTCRYLCNIE